jgi:hypothetical protein
MSPNLQMFAQDCSEEELRAVCKELFTPQRDDGIDESSLQDRRQS